jgi:hypothetical protein
MVFKEKLQLPFQKYQIKKNPQRKLQSFLS